MNTANQTIHPPRLVGRMGIKDDERRVLRLSMLTHGFKKFEDFIKKNHKNYPVYQDEKNPMGFIGYSKLIKDAEGNHLPIHMSMNDFYIIKIEGPAAITAVIEKHIPVTVTDFAQKISTEELEALPDRVQNLLKRYIS